MSFGYGKYFGEIRLTHELLSKQEARSWLLKAPRDGEGDPERILEDATPCMAANGVDPDTARGLVIKAFSAKS